MVGWTRPPAGPRAGLYVAEFLSFYSTFLHGEDGVLIDLDTQTSTLGVDTVGAGHPGTSIYFVETLVPIHVGSAFANVEWSEIMGVGDVIVSLVFEDADHNEIARYEEANVYNQHQLVENFVPVDVPAGSLIWAGITIFTSHLTMDVTGTISISFTY